MDEQEEGFASLTWLLPSECGPGQVVGLHLMWSPHPQYGNDWSGIPPEPLCYVYGEFVPTPRIDTGGIPDNILQNCCILTKGVMGLFQDDPLHAKVVVQDQEFLIPWELPFILAEYPEEEVEAEEEKEG